MIEHILTVLCTYELSPTFKSLYFSIIHSTELDKILRQIAKFHSLSNDVKKSKVGTNFKNILPQPVA